MLDTGPSSLLGGTEGASLHPRPGPRPPLSGRRQEAPQAQAPHPTPGVALSIRLSFTHSFFLCLSFSHIFPVELLGKSNVRPSSCSSRPCRICLSPPAQGHWKEPLQDKEERGRQLVQRGRGLGHSPPGVPSPPGQG